MDRPHWRIHHGEEASAPSMMGERLKTNSPIEKGRLPPAGAGQEGASQPN
jgi:hypothetical protein